MKRLFYAFVALTFVVSVNSCKKCGHCEYGGGSNSDAVCNNSTLNALGIDEYKEAEADCIAQNGKWVKH